MGAQKSRLNHSGLFFCGVTSGIRFLRNRRRIWQNWNSEFMWQLLQSLLSSFFESSGTSSSSWSCTWRSKEAISNTSCNNSLIFCMISRFQYSIRFKGWVLIGPSCTSCSPFSSLVQYFRMRDLRVWVNTWTNTSPRTLNYDVRWQMCTRHIYGTSSNHEYQRVNVLFQQHITYQK